MVLEEGLLGGPCVKTSAFKLVNYVLTAVMDSEPLTAQGGGTLQKGALKARKPDVWFSQPSLELKLVS